MTHSVSGRRATSPLALCVTVAAALGCSGEETAPPPDQGVVARFDLNADLTDEGQFYNLPYPSDLRLSAEGTPDLRGLPNQNAVEAMSGLVTVSQLHPGFPTTPVAYFRLTGALAAHDLAELIRAETTSPVLLIDVDEQSPERGRLIPTVASTLPTDDYVPDNTLAVAPRPGFVLAAERTYAFVLTSALTDGQGQPVGADEPFRALRDGATPGGDSGERAVTVHEPLWGALEQAGVARDSAVAAAVFTTGDVVAELAALSDALRAAYTLTIDDLALDPDDGAAHDRFCELHGTVSFPEFQQGEAPYDTDGLFQLGTDGLPIEQRRVTAPVVITLPKQPMPAGGYPLVMYFHGSGGLAAQVVDRGRVTTPGGEPTKGQGPSHVLAAHGFGTVGSAHPVNPERLSGASELAYINFDNPKAFADTFRQGVIEQRLYLDALLELEIDPALLTGCDGPTLPTGETAFRFASAPIMVTGQSMGGMYANLISAVDPRIEALVPTGAGGFWSMFLLETSLLNTRLLLPMVMHTTEDLTFVHPAMHMLQTAFGRVEPAVFMPRLARRPLPGHPSRPVYEPVGLDDSYFPTVVYDAIVMAYGHPQAGDVVWSSMQDALALAGLDGVIDYPVENNLSSEGGTPYTGVVVQYEGDGIYDPHAIYGQLDEVKHQYGCFFETFWSTGTAVVPAPAPLGTPCTQ